MYELEILIIFHFQTSAFVNFPSRHSIIFKNNKKLLIKNYKIQRLNKSYESTLGKSWYKLRTVITAGLCNNMQYMNEYKKR